MDRRGFLGGILGAAACLVGDDDGYEVTAAWYTDGDTFVLVDISFPDFIPSSDVIVQLSRRHPSLPNTTEVHFEVIRAARARA